MNQKIRPVVTGVAYNTFETHWDQYLTPHQIPNTKVVTEIRRLETFLKNTAESAWNHAQLDPALAAFSGSVFGTFYASNSMNEYINSSLLHGARWLNPEAFLYYSPHSCAGTVVQKLGLHGDAITLVGQEAGYDAIIHSMRFIELKRHRALLCTEFDWPTPFAAWLGHRIGLQLDSTKGFAATLVIEDLEHALQRGASILARLERAPLPSVSLEKAEIKNGIVQAASFLQNPDFSGTAQLGVLTLHKGDSI